MQTVRLADTTLEPQNEPRSRIEGDGGLSQPDKNVRKEPTEERRLEDVQNRRK